MFEVSSNGMPTFFKLKDREGEWILLKDMIKRNGSCYEDIQKKGKLIEMKKSDFLKQSHCQDMDKKHFWVGIYELSSEDTVVLVKIDKFTRKVLNSNIIEVS